MAHYIGKKQKDKGQSNSVRQKKHAGEPTFQFVDHRPEAVAQREIQTMAADSQQVRQLKASQEMADNSLQLKHVASLNVKTDSSASQAAPVQKKENKTGLPDTLKAGIENLSGYFMDDVKVHYNSAKPAQLNAHAYAQGTDIHIAAGEEKHLPHEAWHVAQQKQGRVRATRQLKSNHVAINDDPALEKEADVFGAKALTAGVGQRKNRKLSGYTTETKTGAVQRRVSVAACTIETSQNAEELEAYIRLKQQYDQAEENKYAKRAERAPRKIAPLGKLSVFDLQRSFTMYYRKFSPPVSLQQINARLFRWANAKSPSEVNPDSSGVMPLVSTQDNHFDSVRELFFALVNSIRSESNIQAGERVAFEVLGNFSFYEPTILKVLAAIEAELGLVPKLMRQQIVMAGYASSLLSPDVQDLALPAMIQSTKHALEKLFLSINIIHTFILVTKKLAKSERRDISSTMGDRHDKYSPYGPEIEVARRRGFAVWSGFSGSTADILKLGRLYNLSPHGIQHLALVTAAFFQFLPTSKNPTHTFHEVMAVAHKYFGVPYDPQNPMHALPHAQPGMSPEQAKPDVPRIGALGEHVKEVEMSRLIALHDVPREGVSPKNITDIRDKISQKGYDVTAPISTTLLPNGDYMVTGGHHRIAAMKMLGQRTAPVKVYQANQTDKIKLAYFIGIARITGKYFHEWEPFLSEAERIEVNGKLTAWKTANRGQMKYDFEYQEMIGARPKL